MTHETCPFDSAEDKAEWEELHFSIEDEDAAYERERDREIHCAHLNAFNKWLEANGFEERADNKEVIGFLRNAFFAGASYGIDETVKLYRR